jgi:hypothetical protein
MRTVTRPMGSYLDADDDNDLTHPNKFFQVLCPSTLSNVHMFPSPILL